MKLVQMEPLPLTSLNICVKMIPSAKVHLDLLFFMHLPLNVPCLLIHSANPQSRPVVIIIFAQISVRQSVLMFQNIAKQNKRRLKIMITTVGTVGLTEGIIDDTCLVPPTSRTITASIVFSSTVLFVTEY